MESKLVNRKFVTGIVSKKIYEIRTDFNLTQNELGKLLNVNQPTIARIENGEREIRIKELYLLIITFKVNINWLLSLSDNKLVNNNNRNHLKNILSIDNI